MIVWISSYPRSGNRFFRNLMASLYGADTSETITKLPTPMKTWLATAGKDSTNHFVKTHGMPLGDSHPAIYLIRDARDAMVSYAWFLLQVANNRPKEDITPAVYHDTLRDVIDYNNPEITARNWSENIQSWLKRPNTAIVRFEDLVQAPREVAVKACADLGLNLPMLPNPVLPTFESMKQANPTIVRRGKVGSWQDEFPADLLPRFWELHGKTMRQLGYGDASSSKAVA